MSKMSKMSKIVLKIEGEGNYAEASRQAMIAYARSIRPVDKSLADDILFLVEVEEEKLRKARTKTIH